MATKTYKVIAIRTDCHIVVVSANAGRTWKQITPGLSLTKANDLCFRLNDRRKNAPGVLADRFGRPIIY